MRRQSYERLGDRLWPAETHCCTACLAPAVYDRRAQMWAHQDPADARICPAAAV